MANADTLPTKQSDDFGTVVSNTFRLIRSSWQALLLNLGTILWVYILPSLLIAALVFAIAPGIMNEQPKFELRDGINAALALTAGIGIAILVALLAIASIIVQLASARGKKISFSEVVEQSWPFFWRFIALGILIGITIIIGFTLFIIPGILAVLFFSFATYVMVDKNVGPIAAMQGSYLLYKANWKIVLAYFIVTIVISLPQIVPILGAIASAILNIAYFCLPAILYLRMSKSTK